MIRLAFRERRVAAGWSDLVQAHVLMLAFSLTAALDVMVAGADGCGAPGAHPTLLPSAPAPAEGHRAVGGCHSGCSPSGCTPAGDAWVGRAAQATKGAAWGCVS